MTEFAALGTMLHAHRPFVAAGGHWWASWPLVLVCGLLGSWSSYGPLLSFLGGWDRLRWWGLCDIPCGQRGGGADVGSLWAVCRRYGRLALVRGGGCWLKKPCHRVVTLASSTFNVELAREINNKL